MSEEIRPNFTRISSILSPYNDYDSIPPHILAIAAARGTAIHNLCQLYAEKGIHMPSEHDGYVSAFVKWFDREVVEVYECETRLYCDTYEITGQFDIFAKLKHSQVPYNCIIDIKTCVAKHATWPLQLAGYKYLAEVSGGHTNTEKAVLHLSKDGSYKFYLYEDHKKDLDLFMSCLMLHRYFKKG